MADLKRPGRLELLLRGALVAVPSLVVMVLGGWMLYGSVQVFSRSFRFGPTPSAPVPFAPPPSAPLPSAPPPSAPAPSASHPFGAPAPSPGH